MIVIPTVVPIRAVLAAPRSAFRNRLRAWLRAESHPRMVGEGGERCVLTRGRRRGVLGRL